MNAASRSFQEQFNAIKNLDKLLQEAPQFSSWSTLDLLTGFRMYTITTTKAGWRYIIWN